MLPQSTINDNNCSIPYETEETLNPPFNALSNISFYTTRTHNDLQPHPDLVDPCSNFFSFVFNFIKSIFS